MAKIQMRRGLQAGVEGLTLDPGELAVATDTGKVYVGTDAGVTPVGSGGGEVALDDYYTRGEINALMGDAGSALDDVNGEIIPEHVADKLAYLSETKRQLKEAIASKGVPATSADTFRVYAEKVKSIPVGSEGGAQVPPNPVQVYNTTRPADWLKMPEPQDDEMYLLFHIPDEVSSLVAFVATCTGSYMVELGTVVDGAFLAKADMTKSITSNGAYQNELFAADFGDLTSDGMKQCIIKVSGTNILTWQPFKHNKKTSPANFSAWNIVEIMCKMTSATSIACGSGTVNTSLRALRYFTMRGVNAITSGMARMFYDCNSLIAVVELDTIMATSLMYTFNNCYSLKAIPLLETGAVTSMSCTFVACYSLKAITLTNTGAATTMYGMFQNCLSLVSAPQLDMANVTDMSAMFSSCCLLTFIPRLDTTKITSCNNVFTNCFSLASLKYTPTAPWPGPQLIDLTGCSLSRQAIIDFFTSLPTITTAKAITLTGNPGVSELTATDRAIATNKRWTLTL